MAQMTIKEFKLHLKVGLNPQLVSIEKTLNCYNLLDTVVEANNVHVKEMLKILIKTLIDKQVDLGLSVISYVFNYLRTRIFPQCGLKLIRQSIHFMLRRVRPGSSHFHKEVEQMSFYLLDLEKEIGNYPRAVKTVHNSIYGTRWKKVQ